MSRMYFGAAFALGLATVAWVGLGFIASASWLALAMTVAITGVFTAGSLELKRFRLATQQLGAALALSQPVERLDDWLARVPASLREAVRVRVQSERGALPGPALTPYLAGLLVMLGMLGTFLGMVVTFKGAVFALEGSTDLQAMRSALAEPIKGLGLSFGTSVAGVATSAMLGLMAALARRERVHVARLLDERIAGVLRPFTPAHRRDETFQVLQSQAHALPAVVDRLDALMQRIEQRASALDASLVASHERLQGDAAAQMSRFTADVGRAMTDSMTAGAKATGESIRPVIESAMARMEEDARRSHEGLQTVARELGDAAGRDRAALQERAVLLERLGTLLESVERTASEQRKTVEALVRAAGERMAESGARFEEALTAHAAKAGDIATHVSAGAAQLAGLAETFNLGVQQFHAGHDNLAETLRLVEAAIVRATARSDEQLAYYVAQAREVIDLSIASQQGIVENMRRLQGRPVATVGAAEA